MKRTYPYLLAGILLTQIVSTPSKAVAPPPVKRLTIQASRQQDKEHPDLVRLRKQMVTHRGLPTIDFWYAVAWCETQHHWDRGHDWGPKARSWVSGGLGIANSTWRGYGGRKYARKAAFATRYTQMFIANRIGFIGYQTKEFRTWQDRANNRPYYLPAAGFNQGWGGVCQKNWMKRNG